MGFYDGGSGRKRQEYRVKGRELNMVEGTQENIFLKDAQKAVILSR